MVMGKRKSEQTPMWVPTTELPVSPGHPFYTKLNAVLEDAGFDRFAETECQQFYAPVMGRPSLPPGLSAQNPLLQAWPLSASDGRTGFGSRSAWRPLVRQL
jgi:hypothetical protein